MSGQRIVTAALVALGVVAHGAGGVSASPLVADLSNHLVAITTGFTGTDLLLFGAALTFVSRALTRAEKTRAALPAVELAPAKTE